MVCIDVDIGNPFNPVLLAQVLDRDAAIVEHAKTSRHMPAGMVQTGNRGKRAAEFAAHDAVNGVDYRAGNVAGGFVHADERRRVTTVQGAVTGF